MCKTVASHGFLEFVIPRNEQLSLREAPANVFWRTMAWNTSICKPFSVSGLPYYSTGQTWGSGPVWRGQDPGAAHWAIIPWAGGAWLIKGSFAGKDMYCNLFKRNSLNRTRKKATRPNLGKSMNLRWSQGLMCIEICALVCTYINHPINQKTAPFFKWGKSEAQRF